MEVKIKMEMKKNMEQYLNSERSCFAEKGVIKSVAASRS